MKSPNIQTPMITLTQWVPVSDDRLKQLFPRVKFYYPDENWEVLLKWIDPHQVSFLHRLPPNPKVTRKIEDVRTKLRLLWLWIIVVPGQTYESGPQWLRLDLASIAGFIPLEVDAVLTHFSVEEILHGDNISCDQHIWLLRLNGVGLDAT